MNISLDPKSINSAIRKLNSVKKGINSPEIVDKMLEEGQRLAEIYSEGRVEITTEKTGEAEGVIRAGKGSVWLEFGTGVAKNPSAYPHPKAKELGMNAIGTYGKGKGSNPEGWTYKGEDGKYHHTTGIRARLFMYNTARVLAEKMPSIAKDIIK